MVKKLKDIEGTSYSSNNCGDFTIEKYVNSVEVYVRFHTTDSLVKTRLGNIRRGQVGDPYYPIVLGVGFSGVGEYANRTHPKMYDTWRNMLARCYCPITQKRSPTYIGTTVCEEWHNFQIFAEWYEKNHKEGCHLDKDFLSGDIKVYSPSTCMFVSQPRNVEITAAKHWVLCSPEGKNVEVYNLNKFARNNGLHASGLYGLFSGKFKQHKGWKLPHPVQSK